MANWLTRLLVKMGVVVQETPRPDPVPEKVVKLADKAKRRRKPVSKSTQDAE